MVGKIDRAAQNGFEHRRGQASRLSVVTATVIRIHERPALRQAVHPPVLERIYIELQPMRTQHRSMRDRPERDEHAVGWKALCS